MSRSTTQIWAVIRRYFTVMLHYPIRSFLRLILWPLLLLGPLFYLVRTSDPNGYGAPYFITGIPFVIMMVTLFNVYSISDSLISDKATGMKSLMLSMGLRRPNYYSAMSICLILLVLPVVLMILVVAKIYLLDNSVNIPTLVALTILFTLQLDALLAAAVSFITSSSYSFIIPSLIFFCEPLLTPFAHFLVDNLGKSWQPTLMFLFSFSPYQVLKLFFNDYAMDHKTNDVQLQLITQPLSLLFAAQIFWTLLFRLFAYWFEEVCPWQKVSAVRPFFFCLTGKPNRKSEGDDVLETLGSNSKYFETNTNARELGIRINHVSKIYNKIPAVNDLSFSIYRGETTLLLGHNGAGKSTLMNIILGLLDPNHGHVQFQKRADQAHPAIGVCPQTSILDEDLTVKQHLELFNDIKSDLTQNERKQHIIQTMNDVSLTSHASKRPSELSGGMKRKLSLGIAFVGKSDVLILDEPSSGLDPDSRTFVWNAIRRYRSDRTVLLSTQHMEEADYLGDRIAIMSAGRIVCCGSSVYLNKLFGTGYKLRIECKLSNRKRILDHITKSYFDDVQPIEVGGDSNKQSDNDATVDLTLELKLKDKSKDIELALIRLLEDIENNSESLSIKSYGLKSSSIEDVMLNTSKYFASTHADNDIHGEGTIPESISSLTKIRNKSLVSSYEIIRALIIKHVQVHHANLYSILILKIALPIFGSYLTTNDILSRSSQFWQTPSVILITGHLIYYPVRERASKFKIMQATTNSTMMHYWVAQFLSDLVWLIVPLVSIMIFLQLYVDRPIAPMSSIRFLSLSATVCFYLASAAYCYFLSTVISNTRSSIGYLLIISSLSAALVLIIYIIRLSLQQKFEWIQDAVGFIGLIILPSDSYAYFFRGLRSKCYVSLSINCVEEEGLSPIVISFVVMLFQAVVYTILLTIVEAQKFDIEWYFRFKNILCCLSSNTTNRCESRQIDEDVIEETSRSQNAIKDSSASNALIAAELSKSYVRSNKIIENLSFTVNRGECFGLLGVNGAGKTTTFAMLATEVPVDSGRIQAGGSFPDQDSHAYRRRFGYDPQATPELSLTPFQALYLMARLRGIDESSIPKAIECVLNLLEMSQHSHKNDSKLSGGTKRKLALGMALIGNPAIVALDEPTAGVDPLARRRIWHLLKSLRTHNACSIIISSHAMEECEAICDRITIMASGRLRCIGSFLHLRSKFAKGCTLRVQFGKAFGNSSQPEESDGSRSLLDSARRRSSTSSLLDKLVDELQQQLSATVGPSVFHLADRNVNSVTFNITDNRVRRSILFRMMRDFRQKHPTTSYMINDSSLEDIFISLAREQQQLEQVLHTST